MLNHNIIITRSISPQLCRALGLEKSSRGYSIARPRIDVFPKNAELESMIDEDVADMKWPVTSRFFKRGRLS